MLAKVSNNPTLVERYTQELFSSNLLGPDHM